jgi:hypothetical protein
MIHSKKSLPFPKTYILLHSKKSTPFIVTKRMEDKSLNPPIIEKKTLQKKLNILQISLLLCSKKSTHPPRNPPKKYKRYELKNFKMLLQIDSTLPK